MPKDTSTPVLAYRFYIRLLDGKQDTFYRAKHISGLKAKVVYEKDKTSGGIIKIPSDVTFSNLILHRAVFEKANGSDVEIKSADLIDKLHVKRVNLGIHLLNAQGRYTRSWNVIGAYPVCWSMSDMQADSNEVIMETIEFEYRYLKEIK